MNNDIELAAATEAYERDLYQEAARSPEVKISMTYIQAWSVMLAIKYAAAHNNMMTAIERDNLIDLANTMTKCLATTERLRHIAENACPLEMNYPPGIPQSENEHNRWQSIHMDRFAKIAGWVGWLAIVVVISAYFAWRFAAFVGGEHPQSPK